MTNRPFGSWTPARELDRLKGQLENVYDALYGAVEGMAQRRAGVYPLLNVSEDANNLYVAAELPGVSPEDLEISVQNDSLTLRGERKIPEAEGRVNYHRRERDSGVFRRVVTLPVKIDHEKVKAAVKNGILEITLPKAAEAKPRPIAIQAS